MDGENNGKFPIKMDDLVGKPLFLETPICNPQKVYRLAIGRVRAGLVEVSFGSWEFLGENCPCSSLALSHKETQEAEPNHFCLHNTVDGWKKSGEKTTWDGPWSYQVFFGQITMCWLWPFLLNP